MRWGSLRMFNTESMMMMEKPIAGVRTRVLLVIRL